ncbi:hypothetical protein BDC45DRAFT_441099 [Circinella umbellata]|nr:hypothetical protein BDC45DRAFT_441099 [Circinella umbellata]
MDLTTRYSRVMRITTEPEDDGWEPVPKEDGWESIGTSRKQSNVPISLFQKLYVYIRIRNLYARSLIVLLLFPYSLFCTKRTRSINKETTRKSS